MPATDIARAKTFYETICGFSLEKLEAGPGMEMWSFPTDWQKGQIGGAMIADTEGNTVGLHSQG